MIVLSHVGERMRVCVWHWQGHLLTHFGVATLVVIRMMEVSDVDVLLTISRGASEVAA